MSTPGLSTARSLRPMTPEEIEHLERTRPRPYDPSSPEECARLLRESAGYAQVSLHYGTDDKGVALEAAEMLGKEA